MTSTATKRTMDPSVAALLNEAAKTTQKRATQAVTETKQEVKETDKRFADIAANAFYAIMFDPNTTPEQKRDTAAQVMFAEGTKEERKARIKEKDLFEEYLQYIRKEMSDEITRLADVTAMSEMQGVMKDLDIALNKFDESMNPLVEGVDAINRLNASGETFNALNEIRDSKKKEEERSQRHQEHQAKLTTLRNKFNELSNRNAVLAEDKSFFGLGGIKKSAREQIALNDQEMERTKRELDVLTSEIAATVDDPVQDVSDSFAADKAKLKEILDISSDEHIRRQKDLVQNALNFSDTSAKKAGSVREHLGKMEGQIENSVEANRNMTTVYAILNDAIKIAEVKNEQIRSSYAPPVDAEGKEVPETMIAKMTREQNKLDVEDHISSLASSTEGTVSSIADLTSEGIRVNNMKSANREAIKTIQNFHTRGVASVSSSLSTIITSLSQAALNESSNMVGLTLNRMRENTNRIAQTGAISAALGINKQNEELQNQLNELAAFGVVVQKTSEISRKGVKELREKLDELGRLSTQVQGDIKESLAIPADIVSGDSRHVANDKGEPKPKPQASASNPFASLKMG